MLVSNSCVYSALTPVIMKAENPLMDESKEPTIKIEVNDVPVPITPFNFEIIDEPDLALLESKSELSIYEREINGENENNLFGFNQPARDPHVLLQRLSPEEITSSTPQRPQHSSRLLKFEQENFENSSESSNFVDEDIDPLEVKESTENNAATSTVVNISTGYPVQFECKLCSKKVGSDAKLRIHVGICALYHEDGKRFCVPCNKKLCNRATYKDHSVAFHGTQEEKLSMYKFKCHLCPKQYLATRDLTFHLESHKPEQQFKIKCSEPNCGKGFGRNYDLQRHLASVHSDVKPFNCPHPKCNKQFKLKFHVKEHLVSHTEERPYKCKVLNCNKTFKGTTHRSTHYRTVHGKN